MKSRLEIAEVTLSKCWGTVLLIADYYNSSNNTHTADYANAYSLLQQTTSGYGEYLSIYTRSMSLFWEVWRFKVQYGGHRGCIYRADFSMKVSFNLPDFGVFLKTLTDA